MRYWLLLAICTCCYSCCTVDFWLVWTTGSRLGWLAWLQQERGLALPLLWTPQVKQSITERAAQWRYCFLQGVTGTNQYEYITLYGTAIRFFSHTTVCDICHRTHKIDHEGGACGQKTQTKNKHRTRHNSIHWSISIQHHTRTTTEYSHGSHPNTPCIYSNDRANMATNMRVENTVQKQEDCITKTAKEMKARADVQTHALPEATGVYINGSCHKDGMGNLKAGYTKVIQDGDRFKVVRSGTVCLPLHNGRSSRQCWRR